ncbi:MAG: ParB/RepB/Spo0J family partition protein [Oscillospiraceae bacterium]|nr:ParB/RepB/Spo0J family partition protein [Oscillospiraceae bacterium]
MNGPSLYDTRKIMYVSPNSILPNPDQPRRQFDPASLSELAESILRYGVLQPLTVRRLPQGGFELVAGERRLRASKLAGLKSIPCILLNVDGESSGLIALVENLQRRDLDFIEEAEGLSTLIKKYGISQEEAARRIGKSQSAVANKLRLLKLSPEILYILRENSLSERHARALLRLPDDGVRLAALKVILDKALNVAAAEAYVDELLSGDPPAAAPPPKKARKKSPFFVIKDVRIFLNTVTKGLGLMKRSGIDAELEKQETDGALVLTITIPRRA